LLSGGSMQQTKKNQGFTLIELMVTIAVMGIIAMMAAPSFGNMISHYELKKEVKEIEFEIKGSRAISKAENKKIALSLFGGSVVKDGFEKIDKSQLKVKVNSKANVLYFEPNGLVSSNLNTYPICIELQHQKSLEVRSITINALGVFNTSDQQCS
jgi:prepilin-type N-terminal cleavage/methylation domain-containing protein